MWLILQKIILLVIITVFLGYIFYNLYLDRLKFAFTTFAFESILVRYPPKESY